MNPIIKKDRVQLGEARQPVGLRRGHAKVANLLRVEGEVRAIEFRCSCGESSVIELEYTEASPPPPDATEPPIQPEESPSEESLP